MFRRQVLPTTEKFAFKANARGEREIEREKKELVKRTLLSDPFDETELVSRNKKNTYISQKG